MANPDEVVEAYVDREREVRPFAELSHANFVLLHNLEQQKEGWFYEAMACLVVSAFKTEALCNEIGARLYDCWGDMERLPFENKVAVIASAAGYKLQWGHRPLQTLRELMRARNDLAHGKPETLSQENVLERGTMEELRRRDLKTRWEKLCTLDFARKADEDTEQFARDISSAAGIDYGELRHRGASFSIRRVEATDEDLPEHGALSTHYRGSIR